MLREYEILGRPVRVLIYDTGRGLQVILEGGDSGHVGACALALPERTVFSASVPEHREDQVCRLWAQRLAQETGVPVVVTGGVHFHTLSKTQVTQVLTELEQVLNQLVLDLQMK